MARRNVKRLTRNLVAIATTRIAGCNLCARSRGQIYVEDLCKSLRFTYSEASRVERALICPGCEAGPALYRTLAEWESDEWRDIQRSSQWELKYSRSLRSLRTFLEETPSLGLLHPFGKYLHESVRQARLTNVESGLWWRACKVNESDVPPQNSRFEFADPHRVPLNPQRFSQAGQTSLYMASAQETCAWEILRRPEGSVWIAGIHIERPIRVIDVRIRLLGTSKRGCLSAGLRVSDPKNEKDKFPNEYLIPRFIADLVRRRPRVDGILYTSSIRELGDNLVLIRQVPIKVEVPPEKYSFDRDWVDNLLFSGTEIKPQRN
jgi:hypothetical protein